MRPGNEIEPRGTQWQPNQAANLPQLTPAEGAYIPIQGNTAVLIAQQGLVSYSVVPARSTQPAEPQTVGEVFIVNTSGNPVNIQYKRNDGSSASASALNNNQVAHARYFGTLDKYWLGTTQSLT